MDSTTLAKILDVLGENNLEVNDSINSDYLCTICNKLLINACNGPCGCRYCKECIKKYLKEEKRECPGQTEDCKSQLINIESDILQDRAMNIKISRLNVKCPNMDCELKIELRYIENHLQICEKRSRLCPFTNIGCAESKLCLDKVDEHLTNGILSHSQLLIDWIGTSMNDMESMNKDLETLKLENINVKNKIEEQNQIWVTNTENQMNQELTQQNLLAKMEKQDTIINQMRQNLENWIDKSEEQERIIAEMKQKQENQESVCQNLLEKIKEQDTIIDYLKQTQDKINKSLLVEDESDEDESATDTVSEDESASDTESKDESMKKWLSFIASLEESLWDGNEHKYYELHEA